MYLKLNVYTDDTLSEVKRVVEADGIKIPYRVAMHVIQSLDTISLDDDNSDDLIKFITANVDKMDKIIKATFKVTENEMECIDAAELIGTLQELYKWAIDKINSLKGKEKNVVAPVI